MSASKLADWPDTLDERRGSYGIGTSRQLLVGELPPLFFLVSTRYSGLRDSAWDSIDGN